MNGKDGKDRRITCTQKLTLVYALHATESVKVVLFVHILEKPICSTICQQIQNLDTNDSDETNDIKFTVNSMLS